MYAGLRYSQWRGEDPGRQSGRQCVGSWVWGVCDCLCLAPRTWQLLEGRAVLSVPQPTSWQPRNTGARLGAPACARSWPWLLWAAMTWTMGIPSPDHPDDHDASSSGEGVALSELPDAEGSRDGHDHCASLQEPAAAALPSPVSGPLPSQTAPGEAGARKITGPRGTTAWPPPG